jgi:hypothetical protein
MGAWKPASLKAMPPQSNTRIREDEAISVRAIEPPPLSDRRRHELAEELRKYFAEVDGRRMPGCAEDADRILTEAIRSTRPGYRPHQ